MPIHELGKLAFRVEGDWWVCYFQGNKKIEMARLRLTLAVDPVVKQSFMDMMQSILGAMVKKVTGKEPDSFDVRVAPQGERSGRG